MAWKKIIASFLFSLLVVFFCNNLPCEAFTSYGNGHYSQPSLQQKALLTNSPATDISFSKPTPKRDHIKVRYMGGECRHETNPVLIATTIPEFIVKAVPVHPAGFTHSYHSLLFKLRGPPALSPAYCA